MLNKLALSHTMAGVTAGIAILTISAGSLFGLQAAGVPLGPVKAESANKEQEKVIPVAEYRDTPAYNVLTSALDAPPAGWSKNSSLIKSPQEPFPFSCVSDIPHPAVSFAQVYGVDGQTIQIVTGAYTAGVGAYALKGQMDRSASCAGDTWVGTVPVTGLGTEAYSSTVTKGGSATRIVTWRSGDVVTYLIAGNNNPNTLRDAEAFNNVLSSKLNPVCVNPASSVNDAKRTIWSGDTFTGYLIDDTVTIPRVGLPNVAAKPVLPLIGKDLTPRGFEIKSASNVVPVPVPAPELEVPEVERPVQPSYPVWPLLPAEPESPIIPQAPSADPPTAKKVPIQVLDEKGPGCGWSFTSTAAPNFDAALAEQKKDLDKKTATSALQAEAGNWQKSILTYWKEYATYSAKTKAWNEYAQQMETVRAAWDAIAEQWRVYNTQLANYEQSVRDRDAFLAEQAEAKTRYEKEIEICKARDVKEAEEKAAKEAEAAKKAEEAKKKAEEDAKTPSPSPTATPGATTSPSPSPSPTAAPTAPTADDRVICPAVKPEIIDEKAPELLPKPTPPADPRPVNQRN